MDSILCHHRLQSYKVTKNELIYVIKLLIEEKATKARNCVNGKCLVSVGDRRRKGTFSHFCICQCHSIETEARKYCHREKKNRPFYDFLWPIKHCQQALTLAKHKYYKRPVKH